MEEPISVLVAVSISGTLFQIDATGSLEEEMMERRALEGCEAVTPPSAMGLYVWDGLVGLDEEEDDLILFEGSFRVLTHQELIKLHQTGSIFSEVV